MKKFKFRYVFKGIKDDCYLHNFFTLNFIEKGKVKNTIRAHRNSGYKLISRDLYTGLKDKNGIEIYKGDIVRWDRYEGCLFEVYYSNDAAKWNLYWPGNKSMYKFNKAVAINCEKVGNKYKNPELLKEEQ